MTEFDEKRPEIIIRKSEPETAEFGLRFSDTLKAGSVVAMTGELGAGKTTLTKAIAKGLGVTETITSPTFTIIKEYKSGRIPLYHFDVYRLGENALDTGGDLDEALISSACEAFYDIGGDEYFDNGGICVVEWADIIRAAIPADAIWIKVSYGEEENERVYEISRGIEQETVE